MAEGTPKDPTQELDLELVRRVQRGDSAAFDLLVRKYQHRITGLIGRYIADWSECQDVAQETFMRAYRALGNFRGDAQFYTWLHRIAVNTAKNHLVAHNRRPPTDDIDASDAEQYEAGARLRVIAGRAYGEASPVKVALMGNPAAAPMISRTPVPALPQSITSAGSEKPPAPSTRQRPSPSRSTLAPKLRIAAAVRSTSSPSRSPSISVVPVASAPRMSDR